MVKTLESDTFLKVYCIRKRIPQATISAATGISQTYMSQIMNRRLNPRRHELEKIAKVIDYPFEDETLPLESLLIPVSRWKQLYGENNPKFMSLFTGDELVLSEDLLT